MDDKPLRIMDKETERSRGLCGKGAADADTAFHSLGAHEGNLAVGAGFDVLNGVLSQTDGAFGPTGGPGLVWKSFVRKKKLRGRRAFSSRAGD